MHIDGKMLLQSHDDNGEKKEGKKRRKQIFLDSAIFLHKNMTLFSETFNEK